MARRCWGCAASSSRAMALPMPTPLAMLSSAPEKRFRRICLQAPHKPSRTCANACRPQPSLHLTKRLLERALRGSGFWKYTMPNAKIIGSGGYLPPRVVTNDELAADLATRQIETSDAWITERTGIRQRHIADPGVTTSQLATEAARKALEDAGIDAESLDLIIVATSTPDFIFPSTACLVQAQLGNKGAAAFDVQAVCSGFVYALTTADSFIRAGRAKTALVIGAEVFSSILDWNDRGTCVLFGDGAGAVV